MATAPPASFDPSQIRVMMPPAPAESGPSKSHTLEVLKVLVALIIALQLGAILAVLIIVPWTADGVESNEKLAELERVSNEKIARLAREQQLDIETKRQERQESLSEKQRSQDRLIQEQHREQDRAAAMELARQQRELDERRLQIQLEEKLQANQRREDDLRKENAKILSEFMSEFMKVEQPVKAVDFEAKVRTLIGQFDPVHKSLLISFLYKMNLLNVSSPSNEMLNLQGTNLKNLALQSADTVVDQLPLWMNYTGLSLPLTNLINSSFQQIYLNNANFEMSNMMGASFRSSEVLRANFYRTKLSLSDFRLANASNSNFSYATIQRASFQNANLSRVSMNDVDLDRSNFLQVIAVGANFSGSVISYASFQEADLSQAHLASTSIIASNFYFANAVQANFTNAYLPDCIFLWTDLSGASFKYAYLSGANFFNANVQEVDFSYAFLSGANITQGQLDVAFSISQARLPDGSIGKNKNLVSNGDAQCTEGNETIPHWSNTGNNVVTRQFGLPTECIFQARTINATLEQSIDIRRYKQLVERGQGRVYIEMQEKAPVSMGGITSSVYMNVRFFDLTNNEIGSEKSTMGSASLKPPSTFIATLPCPATTEKLQIAVVFEQANATVDNIYVTIE